ncbi:MAG: hypothetical protein OEZ06_03335 [Myxococcales bacterium]|nr:hypothetical protein [Myxococcales bacterium]
MTGACRSRWALCLLLLWGGLGCKSGPEGKAGENIRATALGGDARGSGNERCDATKPDREVTEYDTSGDNIPDVRKVFLSMGMGVETRLVMICRETDVNADGKKDVIRYFDNDGRSVREEADRNFDGRMDVAQIFQDGQIVRKELDTNHDGNIDAKIFFEDGKPQRAERDLSGRSKGAVWQPDRWEYYEDGKIVRMGTDLDGDSRVDRWDRNAAHKTKHQSVEGVADGDEAGGEEEEAEEQGDDAS